MHELQRRLIDTELLRLIQRTRLTAPELGEGTLPIIQRHYADDQLTDLLGRKIIIDAIARTGYFEGCTAILQKNIQQPASTFTTSYE